MKKIFTALLTLAVLAVCTISVLPVQAAGSATWPRVRLSASSSSAPADNSSVITVTAQFYAYDCIQNGTVHYSVGTPDGCDPGDVPNGEVKWGKSCPYGETITVTVGIAGEGVTPSKSNICGGASGSDTFTIKSSSAGTKTISAIVGWSYDSHTATEGSINVNFTAPTAASAPAAKPKSTAAPAPASTPVAPPQSPTLATVMAGSDEVKAEQGVSVKQDEPLVLSGKTMPNGKVTLYVFSDPKQFTTTADKDGNWSVAVSDLPAGQHHAEIEVTDPATNQTSTRARLLDFSVVAATKPANQAATTQEAVKSSKAGLWIGIAVALVVAGGAGGFLLWKRKQRKKSSANPGEEIRPSNDRFPPAGADQH